MRTLFDGNPAVSTESPKHCEEMRYPKMSKKLLDINVGHGCKISGFENRGFLFPSELNTNLLVI